MKLKQISVFIENKTGRLAHVARLLGDAGVNLIALSLADSSDFGILRLIVNDPEKARTTLRDNQVTCSITDVLAVEVPDRPGGMAELMELMDAQAVNIEYMYAFAEKNTGRAALIMRFNDTDRALTLLQKAGVNIFSAIAIA